MTTKSRPDFRAIIVGGSVAGLTMAHALEKAGIDYTLLERRDNIAPDLGAGMLVWPHGATILDQLGVYQNMGSIMNPLLYDTTTTAPGKNHPKSTMLGTIGARLGYDPFLVLRQPFLQSLYDQLQRKSEIHLNKHVETVAQTSKGIVIQCRDGSEYQGDIVVGADGVRSKVRAAMKDSLSPEQREKENAEYNILYGVSSPMPGFDIENMYRSCDFGRSCLVFITKDRRLFWSFMTKMDKKYSDQDIPRLYNSQASRHVERHSDFEVGCNTKLPELWKNVQSSTFAVLEEDFAKHWSNGRIVCVGDSVHKTTVNYGQGANMAVESVAVLANAIVKMLDSSPPSGPTDEHIEEAFQGYQRARTKRAKGFTEFSNNLTRQEAYSSFGDEFRARFIGQFLGDKFADVASVTMSKGPRIDYLPLPKARTEGRYQWSPPRAVRREKMLRRVLVGCPLLLIWYGATKTLGATLKLVLPPLQKASETSLFEVGDGRILQIPLHLYGIRRVDALVKALVAFFIPSLAGIDPVGRLQAVAFLSDIASIFNISVIEGIRTGNQYTFASMPSIFFALSQLKGIGVVLPVYYFLHMLTTSPKNFTATDHRMTNMAYAKTLLPTVTATYVVPNALMFFYPDLMVRQYINGIWQLYPLWFSMTHRLLAYIIKDTTAEERMHNYTADMPYLRAAYLLTGSVSAGVYIILWTRSPYTMRDVFFSGTSDPAPSVTTIASASARFLRYDYICTVGAALYWTGLQFWDLKRAQKTTASWAIFLGSMITSTVLLGPGAALAGFFAWREKILGMRVVVKEE